MAKKIVRGITEIRTINNQDFDTNNVNDLLSDGEHNYIHRKKKDKTEEYHNLTDNLKTLSSSNTDLLTVTNYNNSNNTATLHPHHDTQKEQVIESTRTTININHAENDTANKTNVDTNPQIVLEHNNLQTTGTLITLHHVQGSNTTEIVQNELDAEFVKTHQRENELDGKIEQVKQAKQDKLTAGTNIEITDGNVINCAYTFDPSSVEAKIQTLEQRIQALENSQNPTE